MTTTKRLSYCILLAASLFIGNVYAFEKSSNEIGENQEKILKAINGNLSEINTKTLIELDNQLQFLSTLEQQNNQPDIMVNSDTILGFLQNALTQTDNRLVIKSHQYKKPILHDYYVDEISTEAYHILLIDDENRVVGETHMDITISQFDSIKVSYLQAERFLLFYLALGNQPRYEKIDNLGVFAVNSKIEKGQFVWIYKNMFIQVYNDNLPELSVRLARNFQKEVDKFSNQYRDIVWGGCPQPYTDRYISGTIQVKGCIGLFNGEETSLGTWYEYNEDKKLIRTISFYPSDINFGYRIIRDYDESGKVISETASDNNKFYQKTLSDIPNQADNQYEKTIETAYSEELKPVWQSCPKPYVEYHANGQIKSKGCQGYFDSFGTALGTLYEYNKSGQLVKTTYFHPDEFGKDYKIVKQYNEQGNIESEKIYNNDALYEVDEKELAEIPK